MRLVTFIGVLCGIVTAANAGGPPPTKKLPVTDTYHGVSVTDDYRWLEDSSDPAVRKWSDAQNAHARGVLDNLPNVDAIRARVTQIMSAETVAYYGLAYRGGRLFGGRGKRATAL